MESVSSWGLLSADPHQVIRLSAPDKVSHDLQNTGQKGIAYGNGRSYGDICLNPHRTLWQTRGLNRFVHFDTQTGILICEPGLLLKEIQQLAVPRGWILPVTPGTQYATLGGAIANDVHGKNHHAAGTLGEHVRRLKMVRTDGEIIECSPSLEPKLFAATVGGFGLTGVMIEVEIQLLAVDGPWFNTETIPYDSLDEFFELADQSEADWDYTVSWIDCLSGSKSRGIFIRGNHAKNIERSLPQPRKLSMPFVPPVSLVNQLTLKPFNFAYYNLQKQKQGQAITHYEPFFYPLDNILKWNRMYGSQGFFQYQSVVPPQYQRDATAAMLDEIKSFGEGSFLAVLKTFGDRPAVGMMSFPQGGVTLALDFPNKGDRTHALFKRLDNIVHEAGGRIYLAKDARLTRELFERSYPNLSEFLTYRDVGISSALSRRLIGS
ncbi:FAD-binding oxidoreductase [[Limnothrix rosea] IAM M-220]|uniref:FAD-binding oxidoreductase n=1 Tax=[Limnothrix rosea] IAM M-220 TaxID=454133 RepID=UPI00095A853E|nr:FAD-binding oxidoreductase [[Limnothrix rosea] IAM M-220]OKH11062.1 FAD-binding oxidoreductase [[Limnothrix rosea] IAM M-220]